MKDFSELIDKICDDSLNDKEQAYVDHLLAENDLFRKELAAQRDILQYLQNQEKKNDLEQYHQQMLSNTTQYNNNRTFKSKWLVAATVLLFTSVGSFAFFKFYLPTIIKTEQTVNQSTNENNSSRISWNYKIQKYTLAGSEDMALTGEFNTKIQFPAGSILDRNDQVHLQNFKLELIEIVDAETIRAMTSGNKEFKETPDRLVYISAEKGLKINLYNPPVFRNVEKVWSGHVIDNQLSLSALNGIDVSIIKLDKMMQDYKKYTESKILIDSINTHYQFLGDQYVLKNGQGMQLEKSFIVSVKSFVANYQNNSAYKANINQAQRKWHIYDQQHQLTINHPIGKSYDLSYALPAWGWYAIKD